MMKRKVGFPTHLTIFVVLIIWCLTLSGAIQGNAAQSQALAKTGRNAYLIGAGDVLEIVTWKEADFSREEVLVRTDGKVSFPLLNDVKASGRTPVELKNEIEKGLRAYIDNPIVTVTVREPASQKFYILGEVANTGEYPLLKELRVLQAFAMAGGFTEWASKKEIILLRSESGKDRIYRVNYKDIVKGKDFSQNIVLQADDTIIVP